MSLRLPAGRQAPVSKVIPRPFACLPAGRGLGYFRAITYPHFVPSFRKSHVASLLGFIRSETYARYPSRKPRPHEKKPILRHKSWQRKDGLLTLIVPTGSRATLYAHTRASGFACPPLRRTDPTPWGFPPREAGARSFRIVCPQQKFSRTTYLKISAGPRHRRGFSVQLLQRTGAAYLY